MRSRQLLLAAFSMVILGDQVYNPNAAKSCKAQPDRREVLVWISRDAKHPLVKAEDWRTRGWLLVRKTVTEGAATANDRRVAMLLLGMAPAKLAYHAALKGRLEMIAYGSQEPSTGPHADPSEGLGAD